jgi:hypothetical protein
MKLGPVAASPFAVDAWFDRSCTLTFAVPTDEVARRLPRGLVPDTFADRWAFIAVAVVQTRRLRPAFLPVCLGTDFILVGYRFFVRCTLASGRTLRGLYILRSETDRARMARLGNLLTNYRYTRTDVRVEMHGDHLHTRDAVTGLSIHADLATDPAPGLPPGSPFVDWREARRFCGPMPFTFSIDERRNEVRMVEGMRSAWHPRPVRVLQHTIPFLQALGLPDAVLASAFVVENIPYHWKRGRSEALPAASAP